MNTKKILYFLLACAFGIAVSSCDKGYIYVPAENEATGSVSVGFDQSFPSSLEINGDDIVVPLVRNTTAGTTTVNFTVSDPNNIFSPVSSSVTFADGSKTAELRVSYDYSSLEMETIYELNIEISDKNLTSPYFVIKRSLNCKKAWQNLGKVQFYDDWFFGQIWEKDLLQSPDGSKTYRLLEPFTKEAIEGEGFGYLETIPYIEFSIDDDGFVHYDDFFSLGFTFSGMECFFADPLYLKKSEELRSKNIEQDGLVMFTWFPILNYDPDAGSYSWWGSQSIALLSLPGGPDLSILF